MLRASLSSLSSAVLKGKGKQAAESTLRRSLATTTAEASASASRPSTSQTTPVAIDSNSTALSLIKSQPNHYAVASIAGRTFLVSKGDLITTHRLKDVRVGDVLVLDRVHEIGSRDYTLRAQNTLNTRRITSAVDLPAPHPIVTAALASLTSPQPTDTPEAIAKAQALATAFSDPRNRQPKQLFTRLAVPGTSSRSPLLPLADTWTSNLVPSGLAHIGSVLPESTVRITAVVTEHTKSAMETIVKFKRRKGYKKTIRHHQRHTRLRIEDIQL